MMARRDLALIVVLSLIWGASFMFIKVADRSFDPSALVWLRVLLGCAVMVPTALALAGPRAILAARPFWWRIALLGFVNTAAPFLLISWAETRIDSGLAGTLQAAAPIFSAVITTRSGSDRVTGSRLVGVLVGFAGVGLLVGSPGRGGILAALAVVLAALGYATGASLGAQLTRNLQPIVVGTLSTGAAAILVMPLGVSQTAVVGARLEGGRVARRPRCGRHRHRVRPRVRAPPQRWRIPDDSDHVPDPRRCAALWIGAAR